MIPGDADRDAFEKHIAEYYKERLGAVVLAASHHGSRTFFRYNESDDPYKDALDYIDPDYVVVSAPTQQESRHGHPHDGFAVPPPATQVMQDESGSRLAIDCKSWV